MSSWALQRDRIVEILSLEEKKFNQTLNAGLSLLTDLIEDLKAQNNTVIPGDDAFKLYDTHGFPLELTQGSRCRTENDRGCSCL